MEATTPTTLHQKPGAPCVGQPAQRRNRIGFQCRRRGEPLGPHDAVHAEGRDRITAVAFERDEERVRSLLGGRVDDQIRALPRPQQKTPDRFVSSQGLPVQSDDPALQPCSSNTRMRALAAFASRSRSRS